ncbi:MAG: pyridoxal-dependent decarboxylase [Halobacteriales archaeon]|nr:pyridoxal-dependent decarboxylase [Halobacteriales archaeon]
MERTALPPGAFINPRGTNAETVRELADVVVDQLYTRMSDAAARSPLPAEPTIPAAAIPETPRSTDALLAALETAVTDSMNPAHPGYIGHMDTIPTTISTLADLVTSTVNNNMLSVEMSPVFSELEVALIDTIATEFGLGSDAGGVLTSGGSLANLQALGVARNHQLNTHHRGVTGADHRPVLFASEAAHTSLQKATMLLGLGTDAVVPVETDADGRLRPDALRTAIDDANAAGQTPFCVVATAGTTTTGNIDPLESIAAITDAADLWLHVDAAYGGALVFSERHRDRLTGIEAADSITFNPQKWCYVAKTCAMVLFAEGAQLEENFRVGAPYMRGDDAIPNRGEVSVQGTRRADVLKLWLTFQHLGRAGLEQLIEESYRLTASMRERIAERDVLELATEPEMNILCFRATPAWCARDDYDDLNDRLQTALLREADVFLSLPTYRDARWLRAVLLNPFTDEAVLDRLFEHIDTFLAAERP